LQHRRVLVARVFSLGRDPVCCFVAYFFLCAGAPLFLTCFLALSLGEPALQHSFYLSSTERRAKRRRYIDQRRLVAAGCLAWPIFSLDMFDVLFSVLFALVAANISPPYIYIFLC